jgi:hypothetical protein
MVMIGKSERRSDGGVAGDDAEEDKERHGAFHG